MADEPQPLRIRSAWPLYVLVVLALLYFAGVIALVATNTQVSGVNTDTLALVGVAVFVVLLLVEIPFFMRRSAPRRPRKERAVEPEPYLEDLQDEPLETEAPSREAWNDELRRTNEQQQGMNVLEYSRPAKSKHRGAVYSKAYVPVAKDLVLRVEVLVADGADL